MRRVDEAHAVGHLLDGADLEPLALLHGDDEGRGLEQGVGVARSQRKQQLSQTPVGLDIGEDLLVFDLSRHDGAAHAFALESVDELREFAEGQPVNRGSAMGLNLRKSFLFNGGDNHIEALRAGSIEGEQWKATVARNKAEFGFDYH